MGEEPALFLKIHSPIHINLELLPEPIVLKERLRDELVSGELDREAGDEEQRDETLAALLWERWRSSLEPAGLDREGFVDIADGYERELRLWMLGDRWWEQCIEGLAGRVVRRLPAEPV
jgi:hypothetical protein